MNNRSDEEHKRGQAGRQLDFDQQWRNRSQKLRSRFDVMYFIMLASVHWALELVAYSTQTLFRLDPFIFELFELVIDIATLLLGMSIAFSMKPIPNKIALGTIAILESIAIMHFITSEALHLATRVSVFIVGFTMGMATSRYFGIGVLRQSGAVSQDAVTLPRFSVRHYLIITVCAFIVFVNTIQTSDRPNEEMVILAHALILALWISLILVFSSMPKSKWLSILMMIAYLIFYWPLSYRWLGARFGADGVQVWIYLSIITTLYLFVMGYSFWRLGYRAVAISSPLCPDQKEISERGLR